MDCFWKNCSTTSTVPSVEPAKHSRNLHWYGTPPDFKSGSLLGLFEAVEAAVLTGVDTLSSCGKCTAVGTCCSLPPVSHSVQPDSSGARGSKHSSISLASFLAIMFRQMRVSAALLLLCSRINSRSRPSVAMQLLCLPYRHIVAKLDCVEARQHYSLIRLHNCRVGSWLIARSAARHAV